MELAPVFDEFLAYLDLECARSPQTLIAYSPDFRQFVQCLAETGRDASVEAIDRQAVRGYVAWLRAAGHKPNSVARRLASLRSFWRYLRDNGYTDADPFLRLSVPKRERPLPTWLTVEECERLLAAAELQPSATHAFRDRAVLGLLVFPGLRKSELLALEVSSVDLTEGTVRVECGKGRKSRLLPMPPRLVGVLADWLDLRPLCDHGRLFTSNADARLGHKGLASILRHALRRAGITKRCTLHTLRHSFACLMLQGGCDLYSLSQMLGHSRLDTTANYLHTSARDSQVAANQAQVELDYHVPATQNSVYVTPHGGDWETEDIWVDAPDLAGDFAADPVTIADAHEKPVVGETNRLYGRVRNSGPADATNFEVELEILEP